MAFPSVPGAALTVGQEVAGKYLIRERLGEGGMGAVFAATHLDLERTVAIKVLREELAELPELVARLVLEARAAARIHSEHVCRVLDVGRLDSGAPYIVMEYLEGADLGSLLETQGPLGESAAVDYLLEACEAVAEAHAAGIIHRDLKPENLFLARQPDGGAVIKVLDFGISKATGPARTRAPPTLTSPSSALGSPHFMAPEQMSAAHDADMRADIWALGAILYQLVTGALAFDGDSIPAVCAAVLEANPVPVRSWAPQVTAELEFAIHRCLNRNRDERFTTVAELAEAIAPFGSARAANSLGRIQRVLEGANAGTLRGGSLWPATPPGTRPGGALDLGAKVETPSMTRNGSLTPTSATGTRRTQRRRATWILAATVPVVGLVTLAMAAGFPAESSRIAERMAAPSAIVTPAVPAPSVVRPPEPLTTSVASGIPSAAVPSRPRAAAPFTPSTVASVVRPRAQAMSAWNPDSFGGRR